MFDVLIRMFIRAFDPATVLFRQLREDRRRQHCHHSDGHKRQLERPQHGLDAVVADFEACDLLVLGTPTYGAGELQADWEEGIDRLGAASLAGKKVALFGLGDQQSYPDTFVDAIGTLYDTVTGLGAEVVGFTDTKGYEFEASTAVRDDRFVGLVLDQDNQAAKSEKRIASWTSQIL